MVTDEKRDLAADLRIVEGADREPGPVQTCGGFDRAKWLRNDRAWTIAVRGFPEAARRAIAAEAEVERLKGMLEGSAKRVADQSELLSRRGER